MLTPVSIIGSIHVGRFRSIPEFIPHAIWLMQDATMDRSNCACKYCAGTPQRKVTESLGLRSSNPTPSVMRPLRAPPKPRTTKPRQDPRQPQPHVVRSAPRPIKGRKQKTAGPQEPMVSERYADLQSMYSELEMPLRRWHREDELVWFELRPPIYGFNSTTSNIVFWPGLIQDAIVRYEVVQAGGANGNTHLPGADVEMTDLTQNAPVGNGKSNSLAPQQEDKRSVRQSTLYKIKVVGTKHTHFLPDNAVLPYSVYTPSTAVRDAIDTVLIDQIPSDLETILAFDPCPSQSVPVVTIPAHDVRFRSAAAPYAFALEIANNISKTWTPTDEWRYKPHFSGPRHSTGNIPHPSMPPTVPNSPVPRKHGSMTPPTSVPTAQGPLLAAAFASQAKGRPSFTPPIPSGLSQEDNLTASTSVTSPSSSQMPPLQIPQKQTRYQGLWWGAERLWTDELVRLKPSRRQISPFGGPNILPPSGPSQSNPSNGAGSIDRSIFMMLQSLFVADVVRENGVIKKECRASGMLFELADEDYVDPFSFNHPAQPSQQGGSTLQTPPPLNPLTQTIPGSPTKRPPIPNPAPTVSVGDTVTSMVEAMNVGADPITSIPGPPGHPPDPSTGLQSNPAQRRTSSPKKDPSSSPSKSEGYYYPLPPAPPGYKFRPILTPGSEVVIPLTFISGRYYPHLFAHPALHHAFDESRNVVKVRNFALRAWSAGMDGMNVGVQRVHVPELERLLSTEGLVPEFDTGVYPTKWRGGRFGAVKEAEKEAEALLVQTIPGTGSTMQM